MRNLAIAIIFSSILALGCASEDTGQAPDGYKPTGKAPEGGLAMPGASKCQLCGKEVAKNELVGLHEQFVCKECAASHKH